MDDAIRQRDRERVKQLISNILSEIKLERLGRPHSFSAPVPFHFPQYSKCDSFKAQVVSASGLEMEALYGLYGMPRDIPQVIVTLPAIMYGEEFADFSIEMFGLKVDAVQPAVNDRLVERAIGENIKISNANPDTIPFGGGLFFSMTNSVTREDIISVAAWRWRVFMNESSLCLENNWWRKELVGGGWIPYILGIVYDDPEKMVADAHRFAPAFRLCNLVGARLGEKRGGRHHVKVANVSDEIKKTLGTRYVELRDSLTTVKRAVKMIASPTNDWRPFILDKYPVLRTHHDLLDRIDPYSIPSDADAPNSDIAPWKLAIEIAARETIPDYPYNSASPDALKTVAIIPSKDEELPEIKTVLKTDDTV